MRSFEPADSTEVGGWYRARGLRAPLAAMYPGTGMIEPGVAAGFLYRTDGALNLIEGVVTNPAASKRAAVRAVGAIVEALVTAAPEPTLAFCAQPGMARRGQRAGMRRAGSYILLVKG